jgi:hypothetical protein
MRSWRSRVPPGRDPGPASRCTGPVPGGEWVYRLDTLNVAYGPVAPDAFLSVPARYIKELASLR